MLLFSQFTMMLDIVEAWLELLGHTHLRFDGTTPMNERLAQSVRTLGYGGG